jgi:hypothetical protein
VVGPHGHERDAADRRAEAAAQAPARQGILPPRRWKVSSLVKTRDGHQKRYRASAERIIKNRHIIEEKAKKANCRLHGIFLPNL